MGIEVHMDRTESGRAFAVAALTGAALLLLVAVGGLLWAHQGSAVFTDLVTSALAWCF
jgi:heme/copper-type cytochrome/quinol oxidase subunit 4